MSLETAGSTATVRSYGGAESRSHRGRARLDLTTVSMLPSPMQTSSLAELTTTQLRRAIAIKEQIDVLNGELSAILGAPEPKVARRGRGPGRRKARKTSSRRAAAKEVATGKSAEKKSRKFSPAARANMRAAAKARWAAIKAKGQNKL